MKQKMDSNLKSALFGALAGAIASAIISGGIGVATFYYTDSLSHRRSAEIQTVLAFSDRGFPLADMAAKYISAVGSNKPLGDLRVAMRGAIAQEVLASENLRPVLSKDEASIDYYQDALKAFSVTLDGADGPTHMRPWVEAFGKAVDARRDLDKTLRSGIGV